MDQPSEFLGNWLIIKFKTSNAAMTHFLPRHSKRHFLTVSVFWEQSWCLDDLIPSRGAIAVCMCQLELWQRCRSSVCGTCQWRSGASRCGEHWARSSLTPRLRSRAGQTSVDYNPEGWETEPAGEQWTEWKEQFNTIELLTRNGAQKGRTKRTKGQLFNILYT